MNSKKFIKGADISFLEEQLAKGAVFKDRNGTPMEVYTLLKKYGVNGVRFRVWNEPENEPHSKGYCTVEKTVEAAKAAKESGMHFLLDYHYSDFWADPGKQTKPKAWKDLSLEELTGAVCDFTYYSLLQFKRAGVLPDMVQVGNEIRNGMLWDDGILQDMITAGDLSHKKSPDMIGKPTNWQNLARLVNAGLKACKDLGVDTMIHLDEGANFELLSPWLDSMQANGLADFDVIGVSYYPHFHGKIGDLEKSVNALAAKYLKPIYIAEVAHPWRLPEKGFVTAEQLAFSGFGASQEMQKEVLDRVFEITANIPNGLGRGVYYWEPVIVPDGFGYSANMGIFDDDGVALPAIESFLFTERESTR
jgi:arabinogalactan endo-1,4-beta-galactosidase